MTILLCLGETIRWAIFCCLKLGPPTCPELDRVGKAKFRFYGFPRGFSLTTHPLFPAITKALG